MILVNLLTFILLYISTNGESPCGAWDTSADCSPFSGRSCDASGHCSPDFHTPGEPTCCAMNDEIVNSLVTQNIDDTNNTDVELGPSVELIQKIPGDNLYLICRADIEPQINGGLVTRYLWWSKGNDCLCPQNISPSIPHKYRFENDNTTTLEVPYYIGNLKYSDENSYLCLASRHPTINGYLGIRNVTVEVKDRKNLTVEIKNSSKVYVNEGEMVKLICQVKGYPNPDEFIWFNNGKALNSSASQENSSIYEMTSILIIPNVQPVNSRVKYTCFGKISRFNQTDSSSIELIVNKKDRCIGYLCVVIGVIVGLLVLLVGTLIWRAKKRKHHHRESSYRTLEDNCDCNPQPEEPIAKVYLLCCQEDSKIAEKILINIEKHGELNERPVKVQQHLRPERQEVYVCDFSQTAASCHRIVAILSDSFFRHEVEHDILTNLYHHNLKDGKFVPVQVSKDVKNIPKWIKHRHILCYGENSYFWSNLLHKTVCSLPMSIFSSSSINNSTFPFLNQKRPNYGSTDTARCPECSNFTPI